MNEAAALIRQCLLLKGGSQNVDDYHREDPVCADCKRPSNIPGQKALSGKATAKGIYVRVKIACPCGSLTLFVGISHD